MTPPRDYVADLARFISKLPPDHDQLRTLERIEHFCHGAKEKLRSERTEGHFNDFLEAN